MLEIDILRSSSQKYLGVLRGDFWVFGRPNTLVPKIVMFMTSIILLGANQSFLNKILRYGFSDALFDIIN